MKHSILFVLLACVLVSTAFSQTRYEEVKREATLKLYISAGQNCEYDGRDNDALPYYENALAFVDSVYGTESVKVLEPLASVVRVEIKLRRMGDARIHYLRLVPLVKLHTEGAPEDVRQSWEKVLEQLKPY